MNACIIKPRILANFSLPKPVQPTTNLPLPSYLLQAIQLAQPTPPLLRLDPIPLAPLAFASKYAY